MGFAENARGLQRSARSGCMFGLVILVMEVGKDLFGGGGADLVGEGGLGRELYGFKAAKGLE